MVLVPFLVCPRQIHLCTRVCESATDFFCSPASIDHTPKPHPASPTGTLPESFTSGSSSRHTSFSSYRDHAQQHGPLQKTIRSAEAGIGGASGAQLGSVEAPKGVFFDLSELPARFRRNPVDLAEIEAIESGGAAVIG